MVGEVPQEGQWGEPSSPARTQGAERGRNLLFNFFVPYKSGVCTFQKIWKTQKKEKGQGGSFSLSYQLQEM